MNSRYYNPEWCRFINADGIIGANKDILSSNLYLYVSNNPLLYVDFYGYNSALTGSVLVNITNDIQICNPVFYSKDIVYSSKFTDLVFVKEESDLGFSSNGNMIRDVTSEVKKALTHYSKVGNVAGSMPFCSYSTFYNWVNHGKAWDIKRKESWEKTIGTPFPGVGVKVMYDGLFMTPEELGNYAYGYLGASFGFSLDTLYLGSFYAANHFNMNSAQACNEFKDWHSIFAGYRAYY